MKLTRMVPQPLVRSLMMTCLLALVLASTQLFGNPSFAQETNQVTQGTTASTQSTQATQEREGFTQAQIESLVGHMLESSNDKDGKAPGSANSVISYDQTTFQEWEASRPTLMIGEQLARLIRLLPTYGLEIQTAVLKITSEHMGWDFWRIVWTLLLILAIGLVLEVVTTRKLLQRLYRFVETQEKSLSLKFRFITIRVVIQLIGLAVLGIVVYACYFVLLEPNRFLEILFINLLVSFIQFRMWAIMLRNIFSPYRVELRPIRLDDETAKKLYLWFTVFFAIIEFGDVGLVYLTAAGMNETLIKGLTIPYTFSLNIIILTQIWSIRHKINALFLQESNSDSSNTVQTKNFVTEFMVHAWPLIFTAWLLLLWVLWLFKTFVGQLEHAQFVTISWWITLAFPVADRIFNGFIRNIVNVEWLQSPTFEPRARRFINVLQNGFRVLLFGFAIFMLTRAIGANTDSIMQTAWLQTVLEKGINFVIIGTVAYVVWELFNAIIEKKLPTEEFDAIASLEGDGGGEGASRAETLLPLIRSCVTSVLVLFLLLSSLHSLGIAITPLLAGAGVVGIALGFGAQKLVQDILSGLFFLVDDAFRKGEYIELEGLRGTVEKISLRSMQLRHHLGAVQTVPYGEIKTVSNLSRDWITMKLELRLSYDTDIEAVRKIIKKVGQEMLAHEEYGGNFILPLKSQGVMRVEESALIIRMKFTSKPGEQWVIRREAYRRVRDALSAANIHFAHREVRVLLPDTPSDTSNESSTNVNPLLAGAGAAATSILATEIAKQAKLDEEDGGDGGDDR